ncbi:MAG: hypothetical protein AB7I49_07625 [Candidatus Nitrosocosmicus sp.]
MGAYYVRPLYTPHFSLSTNGLINTPMNPGADKPIKKLPIPNSLN